MSTFKEATSSFREALPVEQINARQRLFKKTSAEEAEKCRCIGFYELTGELTDDDATWQCALKLTAYQKDGGYIILSSTMLKGTCSQSEIDSIFRLNDGTDLCLTHSPHTCERIALENLIGELMELES